MSMTSCLTSTQGRGLLWGSPFAIFRGHLFYHEPLWCHCISVRQPGPWSLTGLWPHLTQQQTSRLCLCAGGEEPAAVQLWFGPKNLHCAWKDRGPGHLLGHWHGPHYLGHFSLELKPKNHNKCALACGNPQGGQEAEPQPEGAGGPLHPSKVQSPLSSGAKVGEGPTRQGWGTVPTLEMLPVP